MAVASTFGHGEKFDAVAKVGGGLDVGGGDPGDALEVDVVGDHLGPEGQGGDDGDLCPGVVALDVGGRVGFGVPQALGLCEGIGVGGALLGHLREEEVGGSVDDAHHPGDRLAGERLTQRPHDGDGPSHGGLEQQVDTGGLGDRVELCPVPGQQFLVGGDHRLAVLERGHDQFAGRLDTSHDLDDHVDVGVGDDGRCVGGEHLGGQGHASIDGRVAHGDRRHLERQAGASGDVVALLGDQDRQGCTDVAAAEEAHAHR